MNTQKLPQDYSKTLRGFRESGQTDTYLSHVKALRVEGWPLSAISEVFGVSKTTISTWESRSDYDPCPVEVPTYPKTRNLSEFETQNLALLAEKASTVRRFTDPKAASRQAALVLERSLIALHAEGVTITELARACGVTRRAVNQRLEKYA